MKKLFIRALCAIICLSVALCALGIRVPADEGVVFTVQPKDAVVLNYHDYEIVFETNVECSVMLQGRENETFNWGNYYFIESGHKMSNVNRTDQFRLMAQYNDEDYYSDIFTVTWKPADDLTEIYIEDIEFGDLPLGYGQPQALPVTFTNTGENTLRNITAKLAEETVLELIQNREPHDLAPGKTDSETWSVRPKPGLGIYDYSDSVFFYADNISECKYNSIRFQVVESDAEIVYSARAETVDFGDITEEGGVREEKDLVVYATGTGNLTNVHVYLEDPESLFFGIRSYTGGTTNINAGMDSGGTWWIKLNDHIPAGDYEQVIYIYADELAEPLPVTVKARVSRSGGEISTATESGVPQDEKSASQDGNGGSVVWIVIGAAAVICAAAITVMLIRKKNK